MYWIFGLLTGIMIDMPLWWWALGFLIGAWNYWDEI